MPGVDPDSSSTAPAPNTAMALACGVTAPSQVRRELADAHHRPAMHPELVRTQQAQRHAERHEIINDAIGKQRAEQLVGRHRAEQQQQHRFEHADAARHVADDAGGDGDDEDRRRMAANPTCAADGSNAVQDTRRRTASRRTRPRFARRRCPGSEPVCRTCASVCGSCRLQASMQVGEHAREQHAGRRR